MVLRLQELYRDASVLLAEQIEISRRIDSSKIPAMSAEAIIEAICSLPPKKQSLAGNDGLYAQMLSSTINRQALPSVIGFQRLESLVDILFDFNPHLVYEKYQGDEGSHRLFEGIELHFSSLNGNLRVPVEKFAWENKRNSWRQFAESIASGARFLSRFDTASDFDSFIEGITTKESALLVSSSGHGVGFALACDFLKESGYDCPKPDVWIKRILKGVGLINSEDDSSAYNVLCEIATEAGVTAYAVDKLFWLLGTGNFYNSKPPFKVRSLAQEFINAHKLN
jgi:hypothetical protein